MLLAQKEMIKSIWTTNFDGFTVKTAHQYDIVPIEVTLETKDRVFRTDVKNEILCVALHGDYKYGALKNTAKELDSQSKTLITALKHETYNRNFIVLGYSGRDKSLMAAIEKAYMESGAGRLYWCGYGNEIPGTVHDLIMKIKEYGREAFYISTDGFDTTMLTLAKHVYLEDSLFQKKLDELKGFFIEESKSPQMSFLNNNINSNRAICSNLYPISYPQSCFKFKAKISSNLTEWKYCKNLLNYNIIAAPYQGYIYAWGNKDTITNICKNEIQGTIQMCPLTRDTFKKNSSMRAMLTSAITMILAKRADKKVHKNRIWDSNNKTSIRIENKDIGAYNAVEVDLFFDEKYSYFCLNPTYEFIDRKHLTKSEKREFARKYNEKICAGQPNRQYFSQIVKWVDILFKNGPIRSTYPVENINESPFVFTLINKTTCIGLESKYRMVFPSNFNKDRIVFKGLEIKDTNLMFYNSQQKTLKTDFHPMRGLIQNEPYNNTFDLFSDKKSIRLAGIVPKEYKKSFLDFINKINSRQQTKYNIDYVINYPGFFDAYKTGVDIPDSDSEKWKDLEICKKNTLMETAISYADEINKKISDLYDFGNVDVVLIYIPECYEQYTRINTEENKFDLHDYVKAFAVQKHIATQFIREKTIKDVELRCQIMWALSLAIYVKSGRTPWTISNLRDDTAFVGIGYSINTSEQDTQMIIGCSHIYSSDGQGLKYKLSKLNDVTFDEKKNPYLSEDEAYRLGLGIKDLFFNAFSELPKRVVIHKRTPFKKEEIKGLTKCLTSCGIHEIDLIEIAYEENIKCFALDNQFNISGFPVKRGTCFPYSNNSAFLYTHGVATSIKSPSRSYIQGGKNIPRPIKIVRHYGNGNLTQIASEILGLSKMNWNSFGLYTKLPCTIESSNKIAQIGWLLSGYEGATYEFRHFM